jgi:hypothetical protein
MTFTSIPPSLKPVVEDVARATMVHHGCDLPDNNWSICPFDRGHCQCRKMAEAAILAFLNACVERGVGWRIAEYMPLEPDMPFENPAFVLNLGATDDKA